MVRLRGLYILLTKERGFGLKGSMNCGEVTGKYMGELRENRAYFSEVCLYKLILMTAAPSSAIMVLLYSYWGGWV